MKNIVRALVLVLAVTGVAASTQIASAPANGTVAISRMSALPKPMCPLKDPTGCGIAELR